MKRNISNKLLIALCLLAMASCKARKQAVTAPPVAGTPPAVTAKPVNPIDAIKAQQLNFNTFSARASTSLDIDGSSNNVTLNIRINHDKKIWVSITALLGLEVARAVITPDSILVINKLQGLYIKKPFSFIHAYASKQVNYKTLEALLVGNAMPDILNDPRAALQPSGANITISGKLQDLMYSLLLGPDKKQQQLNLSNPAEAQTLQVTDNAYMQAGNRMVPSQIDIQSAIKDKKIQVNLHYTKVDFDQQLEYPFNIPERYSPAN